MSSHAGARKATVARGSELSTAQAQAIVAASTLPAFYLKLNPASGHLSLLMRKGVKPGDNVISGAMLLAAGVVVAESADGVIPNVVLYNELYPDAEAVKSDVHAEAIRILCGDESVELLRAHPKMGISGWLQTGGDVANAAEGVGPLLHTLYPA